MNKVLLFLAALFLLQENCFATQKFMEGEISTPFSKRSGISSKVCDSLNKLPNDIFNHTSPDYIQRYLRVCTQGDTNILLQLYKEADFFENIPKHYPPYKIIETIDLNKTETDLHPLLSFMEIFMQNCGDSVSVHRFFESYVCYQEKSLIGLNFGHS